MKVWNWIDERFGTPQTAEDWMYFILLYGGVTVMTLYMLIITK